MNGGDGLAPARPVANAKEDVVGPAIQTGRRCNGQVETGGSKEEIGLGKGAWNGLEARPEGSMVPARTWCVGRPRGTA